MNILPEEEMEYGYINNQISKIMDNINEDKPYNVLNETSLFLKTMNKKFKATHNFDFLEEEINNILLDHEKTRVLRLLQKIKNEPETSIEYYGEDVGTDERLFYMKDYEIKITSIIELIRIALSKIIKEKIGEKE